ncbi:hypothetical protein SAMN04488065_1253 [Haloplanus vescus]|uniref:Domain of unknown function domain-containing protein n=1 Tax=Haloplanus vescus TaxID=555874 RepID=A0A1H3X0L4_9EURY|nr:hypothetical protein [Haloplanus vescus]SDZ92501.1 hypothetical protein SAMN04488065_1253 [Haloplanus vescus]
MSDQPTDSQLDERPRGILTPDDRQYLRGEKDLSDSAERNARQRIRDRIQESLADFELLWTCLPERDLHLLFAPDDQQAHQKLRSSAHYAIAFLRLGLWTNEDLHPDRIADAIEQAAFAAGKLAHADVQLDTEPAPEGDLLLAAMRDKNNRIAEIRDRVEEDDLEPSREAALRQEAHREATFLYHLFEKGLVDPSVDPEALAAIDLFGQESDIAADAVEKERTPVVESPIVRQPLPIVTDVSYDSPEDSVDQSAIQTRDNG